MPVHFVTRRADLKKTDFVDWKLVADDGEALGFNNHVFTGTTNQEMTYRILNPLLLVRKRQGRMATWVGNFKENDGVLATDHDIGPLIITFDQPVRGAGAQIQADSAPRRFKGRIQAFDVNGNRVAQYSRDGLSTNDNDNSAIFVGVLADTATIKRIEMSAVSIKPSPNKSMDFAINQLDINV
jgi:hypothetical protein